MKKLLNKHNKASVYEWCDFYERLLQAKQGEVIKLSLPKSLLTLAAGIDFTRKNLIEYNRDLKLEIAVLYRHIKILTNGFQEMDKIIKKIEKKISKDTKGEQKSLKSLEKADKKRDKVCDYGKKMLKKKGKSQA